MADPANPARANEVWNPYRNAVLAREIEAIREFGALSGGWAWHYMSPPHVENKQLHDHKDVDLFVYPPVFATKHSSTGCVAVRAARDLVARGESVPGHSSLIGDWGL
jgi:hypothetical protein